METSKKIENDQIGYRELINKLPVAVYTCDKEGYIDLYNDAAVKLWGQRPSVGRDVWCGSWKIYRMDGSDLPIDQCPMAIALKKGKIVKMDIVIERPDGTKRSISPNLETIYDGEGNITGAINILVDITEQMNVRSQIEKSEEQLRIAIEGGELGTFDFNPETRQFMWSNKSKEFFGLLPEQPIDCATYLKALHPEDKAGVEVVIEGLSNPDSGDGYDIEYRVIGINDKKLRWIRSKGKAIFDVNEKATRFIGIMQDITQRRLSEQKVKENEEKLSIVIEASELGTWEFDLQSNEVKYSDRYLEILGYHDKVELSHAEILKHLHPEDRRVREEAIKRSYRTGFLYFQARIIWNDNTIHWVETQGKVIYDVAKNPLKIMGTLRDISKEKKYNISLKEREQKFRLLADSMPQHVWTGDVKGNLYYFNRSVFEYTGLTPKDLDKDGILKIIHPEDREGNMKAWINSVITGKDFLCEHRFLKHTGEYRWLLSRASPQRNEAGEIQRWVGTSTDIQDQKDFASELEKQVINRTNELVQKNIELEKANEELELFAHISSHDLQEPLRKVQMSVSRIENDDFDKISEKGKEHFTRVKEATKTMQTLIMDLQTYLLMMNKGGKFEITDLNLLIEETITGFKEQMDEKKASIEVSLHSKAKVIPFEFKQLFHNIIGNALKFSKSEVSPHITIKSSTGKGIQFNTTGLLSEENYFHLSIADNGIGFEPQYSEKIFEIFQRLHDRDTYKGTGIGLAIVKKIIENHKGVITAKSELNKGATFEMYIPL